MEKRSKILLLIASIFLLGIFTAPMWQIELTAPQYPDGIKMYIWINKISGATEGTIQNMNILNHYVGMKPIEPDSIPELKYFPYVIIGMTILGLLLSIGKIKNGALIWVVILAILGILGMYDFYMWEYDYGHDLSPRAPIKVPGASYQPPLIGEKWLLNFKATSLPYWGSLFMGVSMGLATIAAIIELKRKKKSKIANDDKTENKIENSVDDKSTDNKLSFQSGGK